MDLTERIEGLPTGPGVYLFKSRSGRVLYIGKAANLQTEIRQTLRRNIPEPVRFGPDLVKSHPRLSTLATHVSCYAVPSARVRHNLEALLLRVIPNQTHNRNVGKFR